MTKFVDGQFRCYRQLLFNSFLLWKQQSAQKRSKKMRKHIKSLQVESSGREKAIIMLEQDQRNQGFVIGGQSGYKCTKSMRNLNLRWKKVALYKWRDRCRMVGYIKQRHGSIHQKMKERLLKQAMERYILFYLYCKQHDRNVIKAGNLTYTFEVRSMRRCFDAYCAFVHKQKRAKNYWGRILIRMDLWMKRRAVVTWRKNGNVKHLHDLEFK